MRELIDIDQFQIFIIAISVAASLAGLVIGIRSRARGVATSAQIAAMVAIGPLIYGAWRYYAWTVRYDPQTGFCGLHRVSVLLINVIVFVALGVVGGLIARRLARQQPSSDGGSI
jgi:hypothetical protein